MNTILNTQRRRACASALALSFGALLAACGGGGSDGSVAAPTPAPTSNVDASTYVIVLKTDRRSAIAFGTAFSIGDRLLATNSHVTKGVLESARELAQQGEQVTGVSAVQSETGIEVPLLEALVHPSYTDVSSPDVGLFVARVALPSNLTLASTEEAGMLRKLDSVQVNGFPGDVWDNIIGTSFEFGQTVPQASTFDDKIQALRNFDTRVQVNAAPDRLTDIFEHGADTSPGTSGSPMLHNGKVIGVNNAGVINVVVRPSKTKPGELVVDREILATAAFGIHVKHLHNLIAEYKTGVLEADKRFRLPPPAELVGAGGQNAGGAAAGRTFQGSMVNEQSPGLTHTLRISIGQDLKVTGTATWPANPARNFPQAVVLTLTGTLQANGKIEFTDNMPQVVPNIQRGVYVGNLNSANGQMSGIYCAINDANQQMTHLGEWTLSK